MRVKHLIEQLKDLPEDASIEIRKLMSFSRADEGFWVTLDAPIIALAHKASKSGNSEDDEVVFVIEAGAHLLQYGTVIRMSDGKESKMETVPCKSEVGFTNPSPVKCQCEGCAGSFQNTGNNIDNTITFLICNTCACCWYVPIVKET